MTATPTENTAEWGADLFGSLNDLPAEATAAIADSLEAARTLPAFQEARRAVFRDLGITPGSRILEGGCGTGAALPDLLDVLGSEGQVLGFDPTVAFVEAARRRAAQFGAANARYEVGDIRSLPAASGSFDAAFCDKVLVHAGPARVAVTELARTVRPGGRVGAIEWQGVHVLSSRCPELEARFTAALRAQAYDFAVCANLVRVFHDAGLVDVQPRAFLAHADGLDEHPFWRGFIAGLVPGLVGSGVFSADEGEAFLNDLESLSAAREFSASFIVHTAAGKKPE